MIHGSGHAETIRSTYDGDALGVEELAQAAWGEVEHSHQRLSTGEPVALATSTLDARTEPASHPGTFGYSWNHDTLDRRCATIV
jgi:hypothetical protein